MASDMRGKKLAFLHCIETFNIENPYKSALNRNLYSLSIIVIYIEREFLKKY